MMISAKARIAAIVAAMLLLVPTSLIPLQDERMLTAFHNRTLAQWPDLGSFMRRPDVFFQGARAWVSDRVGFIKEALQLQKKIQFYVLFSPPQRRVTLGRDGFIFLNSGGEDNLYDLFKSSCEITHSETFRRSLRQALLGLEQFGSRMGISVTTVIFPTTPTLYADYLPVSVPRQFRAACKQPLNGTSPLLDLARQDNSRFVYPFKEMYEARDIPGFYPKANFHAVGLSVKTVRDALFKKLEIIPSAQLILALTEGDSEILQTYGIRKTYPIYSIRSTGIARDNDAEERLSNNLRTSWPRLSRPNVLMNTNATAGSSVLVLSDSFGAHAASLFATGFNRLVQINTNGVPSEQIRELFLAIKEVEHFDSLIILFQEGNAKNLLDWSRYLVSE